MTKCELASSLVTSCIGMHVQLFPCSGDMTHKIFPPHWHFVFPFPAFLFEFLPVTNVTYFIFTIQLIKNRKPCPPHFYNHFPPYELPLSTPAIATPFFLPLLL